MTRDSWCDSCARWAAVARGYVLLEREMRAVIDAVAGRVCPGCSRLCCRVHYCRATVLNPWYVYVNQGAGGTALPPDWAARRDPFGLGPGGCEIRAGRYVFCYSYNCPDLQRFAKNGGVADEFREVSDLLLPVNRLPGKRLLHELERLAELTEGDRTHLEDSVDAARRRLQVLRPVIRDALDLPIGV